MTPLHREATTLTLLLIAEQYQATALPYAAHQVLTNFLLDWSDEKKADLYSRIVERVDQSMVLRDMTRAVSDCLLDNEVLYG